MEHGKCQTPHGSGHVPPDPARLCTVSPGKAVPSTHPMDATDGNSLGAHANGDLYFAVQVALGFSFHVRKTAKEEKKLLRGSSRFSSAQRVLLHLQPAP